ncbi:MAG: GIY-YIG nuclease family protein [Bacteroidales bacterium]|jgi:putative endonuclease|nr:GIY-YIG nuclease family protein [Bacteroidales bacterium]
MATFYILYSIAIDKYYVGATCDDISERLRRHNSKHKKGFTGKANDWTVVYCEIFATKEEAFAREREVKSWKSRGRLAQLVRSTPSENQPIGKWQ